MGAALRYELKGCSLPKWRLTGWLADNGPDVPADIRMALLTSLFGTLPIFLGGVTNTVAVAALVASRNPTPVFISWFLFELLLGVVRLGVLAVSHRRGNRGQSTPTDLNILLGVLWAASVGYGTFMSILSGDWVSATLACLSAAAMVGGICFRNFAAPRLVAVMILMSLGPCALGAVLSGEPILLVVAFQIPFYLVSMAIAAYRLNAMLLATMQAERENDRRARHDSLTGVLNRAGMIGALEGKLGATPRGAVPALFYIDLDGFKPVNDAHGHGAGDRLLQLVADRLSRHAAPGELVARLGGDEFAIVAPVGDRAAAAVRGKAIIAVLTGEPYLLDTATVELGASIGVALFPEHGETVEMLLAGADAALYDAKARGRGRCSVAGTTKPHLVGTAPLPGRPSASLA